MSKELNEMNLLELKAFLQKKEELLEEVEEERLWMLTGTCKHVPGTTVKRYEEEIKIIKETIVQIKQIIAEKE